jgi:hypothetical protein
MDRRLSLVAFLIWSLGAFAANGPAFSTGPVNQPPGNFIREATSTLVIPEAPRPIVGNTVLWVGMGTSNGDLIQGINNNYPKDTLRNPCSNLGGNWCVAAYTLSKKRGSISGPRVTSKPGDRVTMHCIISLFTKWRELTSADKFNEATGKYDQKVSVNGVVKSSISTGRYPPTLYE